MTTHFNNYKIVLTIMYVSCSESQWGMDYSR